MEDTERKRHEELQKKVVDEVLHSDLTDSLWSRYCELNEWGSTWLSLTCEQLEDALAWWRRYAASMDLIQIRHVLLDEVK